MSSINGKNGIQQPNTIKSETNYTNGETYQNGIFDKFKRIKGQNQKGINQIGVTPPCPSKNNLRNGVQQKQEIFVKKWVDYSSKYGLGYLLSNGSAGVFFNDCTKMVLDPTKE